MIWPFKRKPAAKPINPAPINEDWAYGDLAECLDGRWVHDHDCSAASGPEKGDVCKVLEVQARRTERVGDCWSLKLGGYEGWYHSDWFRKVPPLNSAADAEFSEQIKRLGKAPAGEPA